MSKKINQVEPNISEEDINRINNYMASDSWITEHEVTKELEENIASYAGRKYAIAVPNGTIAIYLSLLASGLSKGKRVAVPNMTMIATINAILWAEAEPVIVDVNSRLCMSLESLRDIENLDGVIYVPLNGRTEDALEIEDYCKQNQITLIEDSAHALGSNYLEKKCGSLGEVSVFSFTPHKIITMGQGGMVLTDDDKYYEYLINLKTFNRSKDRSDWHDGFGLNFKITDLQSALGLSQFEKIDDFINIKKDMFKKYQSLLSDCEFINILDYETPWFIDLVCESSYQRNELANYLNTNDIITRDSYPPLSKQEYLRNITKTDLKNSEEVSEKVLWLPSSTNLTDNQIEKICTTINIFFNRN